MVEAQQAVKKIIDHLEFPYNKDYDLQLKGTSIVYDQFNGRVKGEEKSETIYHIDDQKIDAHGNWTNFHVIQVTNKDSLVLAKSPLCLNKKGMVWGLEKTDAHEGDKHQTQAILLPLYKGKTWKAYFNDMKCVFTCVTADTSITTPCGTFDAFGVQYNAIVEQKKDYTVRVLAKEFYNQKIGKIATQYVTLVEFAKVRKKIVVNRDEQKVVYYTGYQATE